MKAKYKDLNYKDVFSYCGTQFKKITDTTAWLILGEGYVTSLVDHKTQGSERVITNFTFTPNDIVNVPDD